MFTLKNIERVFAILIILLIAAGSLRYCHLDRQKEAAKQEASLQTGRADAAEEYSSGLRTIIIEREASDARVQQALEANPEYSGQPVPSDVADLLRHPSGSTRAVP